MKDSRWGDEIGKETGREMSSFGSKIWGKRVAINFVSLVISMKMTYVYNWWISNGLEFG